MTTSFKHCRYCTTDRHPGCHSTCEKYKKDLDNWHNAKNFLDSNHEYVAYIQERVHVALDRQAKKDQQRNTRN